MSVESALRSFVIKRFYVELRVVLVNNQATVEPFQCKEENLRLWSGIALTQTMLAKIHMEQSQQRNLYSSLVALFQHEGWEVKSLINAKA